jgi:hypothetical protein
MDMEIILRERSLMDVPSSTDSQQRTVMVALMATLMDTRIPIRIGPHNKVQMLFQT